MGSLSLVVFKHRLYDQLLRNVRGDLSIGFGSVGVFWSEDSEALSYMVMSFFLSSKALRVPSTGPHCPGFRPSATVVLCWAYPLFI